jgi:phage terminase large subunit
MKKTITLKKIRETGGTVIYGEGGEDPTRLKSVYLPKSWFKSEKPEELELTLKG